MVERDCFEDGNGVLRFRTPSKHCLVCCAKKTKNPPRAPQPQGAGPGAWVPRANAHVCAIDDGRIEVFANVVMETHAIDAKAWAIGKKWSRVFNHVPPWTETIPGRPDIDRATKSIEDSDRFMMVNFPIEGTMGAQVLAFAKMRCGAGKEHEMEEAVLLKGGSKAQAYHADDDKTLRCFRESLSEDGSLPYHLSVLVALERDMVVVDFRGDEVKIPKYGAAVWRGDTSHAGGAHEGECLRAFFHIVHVQSERSAKDADAGGVFPPYGPKDVLKMEGVFRVVTRPEYEELRVSIREASELAVTHRLMYYLGASEVHFAKFEDENKGWFDLLREKVRGGVLEAAPEEIESESESESGSESELAEQAPESTSVPQGELASLMAERFGSAWVSVAKWDKNSCHLDTVLDVVRFLHMCKVPSVTRALTTTTAHPWERVRGAIAVHLKERSTDGGRRVSSAVIDTIHGTVCGRRGRRGKHLNAGENMKVVADNLVQPQAKGWLSKVSCCSRCSRAGKAVEEHAEWSYPVSGQDCVELPSDDDDDGGGGGTTTALRLVDRIQGLVSGAAAGSGDSETANPKLCTFCDVGVVRRCRAVTGEAPEFFVLRAEHPSESSERRDDGGMRINFGGKKTLKFPRHQGEEGDPPEGVYRALCRVEHNRRDMHYITKVNIGVMLHHDSDEWYSYDALGSPRVARTEEEGFGSEQCFAVFVNMASVALKEDVVDVSKSLHRVEEHRKSVNAEEVTGSVVGARTGARTRGRARKV